MQPNEANCAIDLELGQQECAAVRPAALQRARVWRSVGSAQRGVGEGTGREPIASRAFSRTGGKHRRRADLRGATGPYAP
eukprot:6192107-Pleurochrysis_carterae.AAC.5